LTAFGVGWLMSDAKMRRRIIHDGRRAMRRASDMIG
jgi:hypothetical protein